MMVVIYTRSRTAFLLFHHIRCIAAPPLEDTCDAGKKQRLASAEMCGKISDANGPFKDCHASVVSV